MQNRAFFLPAARRPAPAAQAGVSVRAPPSPAAPRRQQSPDGDSRRSLPTSSRSSASIITDIRPHAVAWIPLILELRRLQRVWSLLAGFAGPRTP
jgi:hypothetical protein